MRALIFKFKVYSLNSRVLGSLGIAIGCSPLWTGTASANQFAGNISESQMQDFRVYISGSVSQHVWSDSARLVLYVQLWRDNTGAQIITNTIFRGVHIYIYIE